MSIVKTTLHPDGNEGIDLYPKTSIDQVEGFDEKNLWLHNICINYLNIYIFVKLYTDNNVKFTKETFRKYIVTNIREYRIESSGYDGDTQQSVSCLGNNGNDIYVEFNTTRNVLLQNFTLSDDRIVKIL